MTRLTSMVCAAAMAVASLAVPTASAFAYPNLPATLDAPASDVQQVRYGGFHHGFRGHRFYRHGFYGHRFYGRRHWHRGYWIPGAVIAGSIIGGALAAPWYPYPYYYGYPRWYGYPYW